MHIPRVPVEQELAIGDRIALAADTAHHLLRVLRLRDGTALRLFNGEPGDWHATLEISGKRAAHARIESFEARAVEPPLAITLVQGISRGQRMDYTLEKAVELGVSTVVPVVMERTQAAPAGERIARKARHWQAVLAAAAAQSGRTRRPTLAAQSGFREWLATARPDSGHPYLLLDPTSDYGPQHVAHEGAQLQRLTLLAGPEGGFSPSEREAAFAAGFQGVRLGPRVLRTETAAVAALTALQVLYGDLRG